MNIKRFVKGIFLFIYKKRIEQNAVSVGYGLKINGRSSINGEVILGDNCNFNGMQIRGMGKVVIGNNFRSGIDCVILTSNHNYEGLKIPYDATMIKKQLL